MGGGRSLAWSVCALALAALPASGDGDPAAPPGPDGAQPAPKEPKSDAESAAFQAEVDDAVRRGVKYLLDSQKGDGGFGTTAGETGLALWALRHSGVAKDDSAVLRAAERLERDLPDGTTYGTSLGICGLLAHDVPAHRERIQKGVDSLVRGQCKNGQWTYLCKSGGKSVGDNSNTQCAALALGAARIRGFRVPDETLTRLLRFASKTQNEDGGWGYAEHQSSASYGAMTAGMLMTWGLVSAALVNQDPRKLPLLDDPEGKRALRWLGTRFRADRDPGPGDYGIYWLWSLERAGVLLGFDRVGLHDWYARGAAYLVENQSDRGTWIQSRVVPDTCWALLFLRRGSLAVVTPGEGELGATTPGKDDEPGGPPK